MSLEIGVLSRVEGGGLLLPFAGMPGVCAVFDGDATTFTATVLDCACLDFVGGLAEICLWAKSLLSCEMARVVLY